MPRWIPNRNYQSPEYRYGFQGQEKDDEIKGEGNSINYKYRMHDPRAGRFFAVDPLTAKYPHYTPYSFSGNKVIHAIELEGLEEFYVTFSKIQANRIEAALQNQDYEEVYRIIEYGMINGFVDDECEPSCYIYSLVQDSWDYQFLSDNSASTMKVDDPSLGNVTEFYYYGIADERDKYGNKVNVIRGLGGIDWDDYKRKINSGRLSAWHEFMRRTEDPYKYIEEYRDVNIRFLNGENLPDPPDDRGLLCPSGAFDTNIHSMNRTNQSSDAASWANFMEDYKENPEKYQEAVKKYIDRFYGDAFEKIRSQYTPIPRDNEFSSPEDALKGKPKGDR